MRYIIVPPVRGGYAWWDVRDTERENATVASFSRRYPGAEKFAKEVREFLEKR